jgi:hypothetical protein
LPLQNQEDNVHDVERKYIIDRGTRAVEVQERGRIRGVGPSRGDMEPSYILNHNAEVYQRSWMDSPCMVVSATFGD